jgi:diguanylate cyclase (GGDEF)-like protein/PAS domain S-box-containing protein
MIAAATCASIATLAGHWPAPPGIGAWLLVFSYAAAAGILLMEPARWRPLADDKSRANGIVDNTGEQTLTVDKHGVQAKALRSSQSRFSTIFHSSPDAILIIRHADGSILDFNTGFSRLLGYTREEAIGELEERLNLWVDAGQRTILLQQLATDLEVRDFETTLVAKNGERLETEITIKHVDIDGELCLICVGRDITSRRRAEMALKESEQKFASIFFNSPDGIVIVSSDNGRIVDVNDTFLKLIEYDRSELLRRRVQQLGVFADDSDLTSVQELLAEQRFIDNVEIKLRARTGATFPVLVSITEIRLKDRRTAVCLIKDIRHQRDTELMLARSEERFRSAFENAPIGMLLVSTGGYVFQANRFVFDLLRLPEEDLIGAHLSRLVPNEDRTELKEMLQRLLQREQEVSQVQRQLVRNDGSQIWTNFHVAVHRNEHREALYYIVQMADITEMRKSQERMERMAFYDTLTDLANRRLFATRLGQSIEHVLRTGKRAALLYLDLDQFKRVNDTLGHEAGDELLRAVSRRLSQCIRKEDTVARPGGDEFTILLYNIASPADAGRVAEKILDRLRVPITVAGQQVVVTTSIGITIIPDDSVHPSVLTKNADLAMYRAKEHGRNNYQYFSEDMNTRAIERLRTENELRAALSSAELELFYQPKLRLSSREITGAECLLRWHHPTRGLMLPEQFIGIAEESGAIVEIGHWIIRSACAALRRLHVRTGKRLDLSINISPRQFRDPELVATVRNALYAADVLPSQLEIEITESLLMDDSEAAADVMTRLNELGVRIAVDDFGTGYSSLIYLKRFPIHTLKIDRDFVMDIPGSSDDVAITSAVIAMAHQLNLNVVAEGVETEAQLEFLIAHACDYGQGYYFGRPAPYATFEQLLDSAPAAEVPRPISAQPHAMTAEALQAPAHRARTLTRQARQSSSG